MGDFDLQTIASLAAFLEENWAEDFAESLAEDEDVTLGFALARAVNRGWVTPSEGMTRFIEAAENFRGTVGDL